MPESADFLVSLHRQREIIDRVITDLTALREMSGASPWPISIGRNGNGHKAVRRSKGKPGHKRPYGGFKTEQAKRDYQADYRRRKKALAAEAKQLLTKAGAKRVKKVDPHAEGFVSASDRILRVFDEQQRPLGVKELTEIMLAGGWTTSAQVPQDNVHQSLYVLVKNGKLRKFAGSKGQPGMWGYPKWAAAAKAALKLRQAEGRGS